MSDDEPGKMPDYFGEKATQVVPATLTAFGIKITSRWDKGYELVEMINFAESAAKRGVAHYVREAFYNSKMSHCNLKLDPSVKLGDPVAEAIVAAADECISCYVWDGCWQGRGTIDAVREEHPPHEADQRLEGEAEPHRGPAARGGPAPEATGRPAGGEPPGGADARRD